MGNKTIIALASIVVILVISFLLFRKSPLPNSAGVIAPETAPMLAREAENFSVLTSAQLAMMSQKKDFFFVNVHMPYEGEIQGTDAFVPYDTIADNLEKLPNDKNARIVLYCKSGRMSEIAARKLAQLGYRQVSHLAGGMVDWEKGGYKIYEK